MRKRFLFLGCGKMGSAIIKNFISNGAYRADIMVVDPNLDIADVPSLKEIDKFVADIVVFAIKPQGSEDVIRDFAKQGLQKSIFNKDTIFVSILAGKTSKFFEDILGGDKKIIRLMPNLPILVGEGMSAYFSNKNVEAQEEELIASLFGQNMKIEKEELMNQVTAISGSGPAYLFLFAKYMVEAGVKSGLDVQSAKKLTIQTLVGASKMLQDNDNIDELVKNVSSKGGTTQAALDVFNKNDSLSSLTSSAIEAAVSKSKELS